jgi:hypothetical protein
MAGVVALFALAIGSYGALSLATPPDADDDDGEALSLTEKQKRAQAIGQVGIDHPDDLGGNMPALPSTLADFWPVLRGDLHRVNFSAAKQRRGYVSSRWHRHLPTNYTQSRRDVGMLPPDQKVPANIVEAQRDRAAFLLVENQPWMMQPFAFDNRLIGPSPMHLLARP